MTKHQPVNSVIGIESELSEHVFPVGVVILTRSKIVRPNAVSTSCGGGPKLQIFNQTTHLEFHRDAHLHTIHS